MAVAVFTQCMDGHFYAGLTCPLDGSTSDDAVALAPFVAALTGELSRRALLEVGAPADVVAHALIVDVDEPGRYGPPPGSNASLGPGPIELYLHDALAEDTVS